MTEILLKKDVSEKYHIPLKTLDYLIATKQIPYSRMYKRNGIRFSSVRLAEWFAAREMAEYHKGV